MDDHAIPARHRQTRFAAVLVTALVALGAGSAAAIGEIASAGDVNVAAERITPPFVPPPEGDGLLFPIDPVPLCLVFNNYGGYSKSGQSGGHQGVDIGATEGQEVYAVGDGVLEDQLVDLGSAAGYGWKLRVKHPDGDEVQYRYYHLAGFADGLEEGSIVQRGQVIGYVGDTGNATPGGDHLHFEVRPGPVKRYGSQSSVDPVPLLDIPDTCTVYP